MVFLPVAGFWALFFQYGSAWILQAERMNRVVLGVEVLSAQVTTLNAIFVLTLIPIFAGFVYPAIEKLGVRVTPLRKMTVGMFVSVLSFASAAAIQLAIDAGGQPHIAWQVFQYLFISMGEVLVSVTALEFAYTQAPASMKSTIMSIWYVTIAAGSLLTAAVAALNQFEGTAYYLFFTALMLAAAVVFAFVARWYRPALATAPAA
jgi:POT family proton-dependent oligopeptide transporter